MFLKCVILPVFLDILLCGHILNVLALQVRNEARADVRVAINHWGCGADTSYFTISSGGNGTWNRAHERGFVMSVRAGGSETPYFVHASSDVVITDSAVKDRGRILKPANQPQDTLKQDLLVLLEVMREVRRLYPQVHHRLEESIVGDEVKGNVRQ